MKLDLLNTHPTNIFAKSEQCELMLQIYSHVVLYKTTGTYAGVTSQLYNLE